MLAEHGDLGRAVRAQVIKEACEFLDRETEKERAEGNLQLAEWCEMLRAKLVAKLEKP